MASSALFAKLNLKDQAQVVVLNAPHSFEPELARLKGIDVRRELSGTSPISFVLAFVTQQSEIDSLSKKIGRLAQGDALVWLAYPKGTSKRYKSEINRDNGWSALGAVGFESVRMVAIDEDWCAKRVRRVEFIKTMKRDSVNAMSRAGKVRTTKTRR
jgi:hypothetical protein